LSIVVKEGRNRQVRNMCEAVGHPVDRLRRVRIGPIADEHIRPGEFRELDSKEVAALRKGRGVPEKNAKQGRSLRKQSGPKADQLPHRSRRR
jgi:23S rRNA pseudouridine2605 synthase